MQAYILVSLFLESAVFFDRFQVWLSDFPARCCDTSSDKSTHFNQLAELLEVCRLAAHLGEIFRADIFGPTASPVGVADLD
jgi:hypothetical protein